VGAIWSRRDTTPSRIREEAASAGRQDEEDSSLDAQLRLLELTSAGLWLLDPDGVTRWVNEAAGELMGITPADLVGVHVSRFIDRADAMLAGDRCADFKVTRPDGTGVWLAARPRPFLDERGGSAGTLLTLQDIDERKRREADLRMRLATKEALVNLAELSLDAPDLKAILHESVRTVAEQLDAVLATVSWIDLERRELWVLAADGHYDDAWLAEVRTGNVIPLPEQSLAVSAVEHSSPVVVEDFRKYPFYDRTLADHGVRSGAFVPLGDGQLVLTSLSRRPGASGASAVALIQSVARMIGSYRLLIGETHHQNCAVPQSGPLRRPLNADHLAARPARRIPRRPV
jgi:HTH-type transcriptional regulator, bacterioopsin transcriptional activator and related proteins